MVMSNRDGLSFRHRLADHDQAMAAAKAQTPAPGAVAARLAEANKRQEAAIADLSDWTRRLRRNRAQLLELQQRQLVERLAMQRTARRIVWGWPANRLRILIVLLWVRVHPIITGCLLVMLILGILALIFPSYAKEIVSALIGFIDDLNGGP
jgi:hypothetical protein